MNIADYINKMIDERIQSSLKPFELAFKRTNEKIDNIDNVIHLKDVDSFHAAKDELMGEIEGSLDSLERNQYKVKSQLMDCQTKGEDNHALIELQDAKIQDLYSQVEDNEASISSNESDIHSLDLRIDCLKSVIEDLDFSLLTEIEGSFVSLENRTSDLEKNHGVLIQNCSKIFQEYTMKTIEENKELRKRLERLEAFLYRIGDYFDVFNDIQNDLEKNETD